MRENALASLGNSSQEDLERAISDGVCEFSYQHPDVPKMHPGLLDLIKKYRLDAKWSWQGFFAHRPGIILLDGRSGKRAEFLNINGEIVLHASELQDHARVHGAQAWSAWKPRRLVIADSNHALLDALSQNRPTGLETIQTN